MPVENERKYILGHAAPKEFFSQLLRMPGAEFLDMRQGYLDGDGRIRQTVYRTSGKATANHFTYKTRVNKRQIEIETPISTEDFDALWTKVQRIVVKRRVVVPTYSGDTWEVDFFMQTTTDIPYLIMAEVELPDGKVGPDLLPAFVSSNLLHAVEYGDKRFNSKELSKPSTVEGLLKLIRNAKLPPAQGNGE